MVGHESKNTNPAEQILDLGARVYDLRNELLFNRVGQDGMQALADQNAEEIQLRAWQNDLSAGGMALDAALRAQEYDELSREMFEGRDFNELEVTEQQRIELSARLLSEFSYIEREVSGPLATMLSKREELDVELNDAFRQGGELFKYRSSQQAADKLILYNDNPNFVFALPGRINMQLWLTVERYDGQAEARMKMLPVDHVTGLPIDLLASFSKDSPIREELRAWLEGEGGSQLDPELLTYIKRGLDYVRLYLEDKLKTGDV